MADTITIERRLFKAVLKISSHHVSVSIKNEKVSSDGYTIISISRPENEDSVESSHFAVLEDNVEYSSGPNSMDDATIALPLSKTRPLVVESGGINEHRWTLIIHRKAARRKASD